MATRVYGWEDNPAIDPFRFKLSDARAQSLVDSGRGEFLTLPLTGRRVVIMYYQAPRESALSCFEQIAHSAGYFPPAEVRGCRFQEPPTSPRYWLQNSVRLTA